MSQLFRSHSRFNALDIGDFRQAFNLFDRDSDGAISFKEFTTIMRAFGQKYGELDLTDMFTESDEADTGLINFEQFIKIMELYYEEDISEEALLQAFKAFDKEGSGIIPRPELKEIMQTYGYKMSDDEFTDFITTADANRDGNIKYEAFAALVASFLADD